MKRKIVSIMVIMLLFISYYVTPLQVNAKHISNEPWMDKILSEHAPYQELIKNYPEAKLVSSSVSYILQEVTIDAKDNILSRNKFTFNSLEEMDDYETFLKSNNKISPHIVDNGGGTETDYGKMKIGLTMYKYSSTDFFVATVFEWITLPVAGSSVLSKFDGVVGLAVNPQLSFVNGTYSGRISYTSQWLVGTSNMGVSETIKNTANGGLTIKATSANGIGYSISEPHYVSGNYNVIMDMQGVLSATAKKSNPGDWYCSAYGGFSHVKYSLSIESFSVSLPMGISFALATIQDSYSHQDAIDIR